MNRNDIDLEEVVDGHDGAIADPHGGGDGVGARSEMRKLSEILQWQPLLMYWVLLGGTKATVSEGIHRKETTDAQEHKNQNSNNRNYTKLNK